MEKGSKAIIQYMYMHAPENCHTVEIKHCIARHGIVVRPLSKLGMPAYSGWRRFYVCGVVFSLTPEQRINTPNSASNA